MNPLSFCEDNSIQFSEKRSQFPEINNATRGKARGQHTHKSTSLSIVRDFQPDAVDSLQLNKSGHSRKIIFVGFL